MFQYFLITFSLSIKVTMEVNANRVGNFQLFNRHCLFHQRNCWWRVNHRLPASPQTLSVLQFCRLPSLFLALKICPLLSSLPREHSQVNTWGLKTAFEKSLQLVFANRAASAPRWNIQGDFKPHGRDGVATRSRQILLAACLRCQSTVSSHRQGPLVLRALAISGSLLLFLVGGRHWGGETVLQPCFTSFIFVSQRPKRSLFLLFCHCVFKQTASFYPWILLWRLTSAL